MFCETCKSHSGDDGAGPHVFLTNCGIQFLKNIVVSEPVVFDVQVLSDVYVSICWSRVSTTIITGSNDNTLKNTCLLISSVGQ